MKTITLTERRAAVRRVPQADLDDLLGRFRGIVEVTPTFTRGVYRLVGRGYAGTFRTTNLRWELLPKLPWSAIRWMASRTAGTTGDESPDWGASLANLLADRLADLIRERTAAGLHFDYAEQQSEDSTVRGRIDLPKQLREGLLVGARFHLVNAEFTADVVWNRLPKAAARRLLAVPGLASDVRQRLTTAVAPFVGIADHVDFPPLRYDARTELYRPLIRFAQLILGQSAQPEGGSLLVNLEQLFQLHVGEVLARTLPPGWSAEPQCPLSLTSSRLEPVTLRPDLVIRDTTGPRAVWDAKWKPLTAAGPQPDDVHQALGYATALGVKVAGLIYPGRRFFATVYRPVGSEVALHVMRMRLVGSSQECERADQKLGRVTVAAVR